MRNFLPSVVLCLFAAPVLAQDDAVYAPCLMHFAAPEEFADIPDYVSAMEDAGWTHRVGDIQRGLATPALANVETILRINPLRFRDASDVQAYVDRAMQRYQPTLGFVELFTRDGMSASITAAEVEPGMIAVLCTFAGPSVPDVARVFAQDQITDPGRAFTSGRIEPDLPEGATNFRMLAVRFEGDEATLAPLSAREGVLLAYNYLVPE